jgi:hypothetical protein
MKNRTREICTSGTVRDEGGNILIYSANDRGDRGNVGIIRSPIRASILPDHSGSSSRARFKMPFSKRGAWVRFPPPAPRVRGTYAGIASMRLNPVAPGNGKARFHLKLATAKSA